MYKFLTKGCLKEQPFCLLVKVSVIYICKVKHSLSTHHINDQFRTAVAVSIFLLMAVVIFLLIYGKQQSFIIINSFNGESLDTFFKWATYLGDGLIYIPIVLYCLFFNRNFLIPVIAGIIICTFLTHFLKRVIFPDELRPISLEIENVVIHKIQGVTVHREHSFPSGHTSTAFSMALLLSSIMRKKIWAFLLPFLAFIVGYSRVYLSQHFVTDVCAGMTIGMITAFLSLLIYKKYMDRKKVHEPEPMINL
jgi:membrane-associated phospholipid phosphatase